MFFVLFFGMERILSLGPEEAVPPFPPHNAGLVVQTWCLAQD